MTRGEVVIAIGKFQRLLPYARSQWPTIVVIFGLTAAMSVAAALQPWPMKILVDNALGASTPREIESLFSFVNVAATPANLVILAASISFGMFLLGAVLDAALSWCWTLVGQRMVYDLAADMFARLQRLSLLDHSRRSVGDSLSRLGDAWSIYSVTDNLLIAPWQKLITIATVATIAWMLDAELAALTLATAPALAVSAVFFGRLLKRRTKLKSEAHARLTSFVHRSLTALPVVQAFNAESRNRREFQRLADHSVELAQRGNLLTTMHGLVNGLITTIGTGVVLFVGGKRVLEGSLSLGTLLVFIAYLKTLQGASQGLLATYTRLKTAEASVERVLEVLDEGDEVHEIPGARPPPEPARGVVRLEEVTVGYEPGRPVLRSVNLELRPGELVALVGPTGAGKSTLAALVPRLMDPWEGRVTLDGADLKGLTLSGVRSRVAVVLQEPFLMPLSVADNIAYGRLGATREEIEAAAVAADADEFIQRLPGGYDTVIGERGATLSGGQRQRLAIARALLKDAPVLVLDEPTSALDARTEAGVLQALSRLSAGRATLVVAHRLSTVLRADRVVVLDGGRIVQEGRHAELVKQPRLYRELHDLQTFVGETGTDA